MFIHDLSLVYLSIYYVYYFIILHISFFCLFTCKLAKYGLIISWAIPGQGGHQQFNELSNKVVVKVGLFCHWTSVPKFFLFGLHVETQTKYTLQMMEDKGLKYLKEESDIARQRLSWLKYAFFKGSSL